jgi:hypothetical protein
MGRLGTAMWGALALIGWTHVGYPVAAGAVARDAVHARSRTKVRFRPSRW